MNRVPQSRARSRVTRIAIGLVTGLIVFLALALKFGHVPQDASSGDTSKATIILEPPAAEPATISREAPVPQRPPRADSQSEPLIGGDPIAELRRRTLDVPVAGIDRTALQESFNDFRNGTQRHEGIDILAPRNTPVLAVEDGRIAKLFTSVPGGLTIYQSDPGNDYIYYYAHLERYADGMTEGMRVTRHQVIGYVGTTGNAPKDTPHLHFEISKLTSERQWWKGTAIDPYRVLK